MWHVNFPIQNIENVVQFYVNLVIAVKYNDLSHKRTMFFSGKEALLIVRREHITTTYTLT